MSLKNKVWLYVVLKSSCKMLELKFGERKLLTICFTPVENPTHNVDEEGSNRQGKQSLK
jgi:hypothetical protein